MPKNCWKSATAKNSEKSALATLRKTPLYKELNAIGKANSPLATANLAIREALLATQAVISDVGAGASDQLKAESAARAIKDSVARLQAGRERHIGEAIFGINSFNGKALSERLDLIAEPAYGKVSEENYWKRRSRVLRDIIHYLQVDPAELPPQPFRFKLQPSELDSVSEEVQLLTFFALQQARLHFALLAAQFSIHETVDPNRKHHVPLFEVAQCMEEVVYAYFSALTAPLFLCGSRPPQRQSHQFFPQALLEETLQIPGFRQVLSDATQANLIAQFRVISELVDDALAEATAFERHALCTSGRMRLAAVLNTYFDIEPDDFAEFFDPWDEEDGTGQTISDRLLRATSQMVGTLQKELNLPLPVEARARRAAIKRLSLFFGVEEWLPEETKQSLNDRAERYFEAKQSTLLNM